MLSLHPNMGDHPTIHQSPLQLWLPLRPLSCKFHKFANTVVTVCHKFVTRNGYSPADGQG